MINNELTEIRKIKKRFYEIRTDLIQSKDFNFTHNLNVFVDFCETNPLLTKITEPLKNNSNTDLDKWWSDIQKTGGSFIGSKRYKLPLNPDEETALLYKFILGINTGKYDVLIFALDVYGSDRTSDAYYEFNNDIIRKLIRGLEHKLDEAEQMTKQVGQPNITPNVKDKKAVFVVHGRNMKIRDDIFAFLRSIGLKPIEWSQAVIATGKPSPYIGEVLDTAFSMAQAVVVLMTPDDEGQLLEVYRSTHDPEYESKLTPQARLNVIFEAGIAMGRDQNRTVLVELGKLRPFSDVGGRHVIRLDNSPGKRQEFSQRLKVAGCDIDISGTDWYKCGDFVI
jgi:predicted nucleotide-binding protein